MHDTNSGRIELTTDDPAMRPTSLRDYLGQEKVVTQCRVAVEAALQRGEPMDHVLVEGPSGLGKTTLANVLANEMYANLRRAHAATLKEPVDLVGPLLSLQRGDILFIDEIHAMPREAQEYLYTAMEDHRIDVLEGHRGNAVLVSHEVPHFTLVGATTRGGDLDSPFRGRFGIQVTLEYYDQPTVENLILALAAKMPSISGIRLDAVESLASRCRGTPRTVHRLLSRCRDHAQVHQRGELNVAAVASAMAAEGIDDLGLTTLDRQFLSTLITGFGGGPAGLAAVASGMGRGWKELEEVCEPYLMRVGMLVRTSRGRRVTPKAIQHLDKTTPAAECGATGVVA